MVVAVLMTSCHVSMLLKSGKLGTHTKTSSRQRAKNHAPLTNWLARSANLSNSPTALSVPRNYGAMLSR